VRIACAIPARLESKRFPRKVLADFGGEPLVCRVWRQLSCIAWLDELCVLTDSMKVCNSIQTVRRGIRAFVLLE
jgi:CMP-2-keto-3-deoxyoctulosonic acid synthetase